MKGSGMQGVQGTRVQRCRGAGLMSAGRSESAGLRGAETAGGAEGTGVKGSGMQGVQGTRMQRV